MAAVSLPLCRIFVMLAYEFAHIFLFLDGMTLLCILSKANHPIFWQHNVKPIICYQFHLYNIEDEVFRHTWAPQKHQLRTTCLHMQYAWRASLPVSPPTQQMSPDACGMSKKQFMAFPWGLKEHSALSGRESPPQPLHWNKHRRLSLRLQRTEKWI